MHPKFKEAINFHKNRDLKSAKKICNEILINDPKNFDALHLLGVILYQLNNYEESEQAINKAIKINSINTEAYNNYGIVLKKLNRKDEALKCWKESIILKPDNFNAYNNCGHLFVELKNFDKALECYNKVIEIKQDHSEAYNNKANILSELGKKKEALDNYNKAIDINPNYAEAYNNKATILKDLNKQEQALESYNKAVKINPNINFLLGSMIFTKLNLCEWDSYKLNLNEIENKIINKVPVTTPFSALHFFDSPSLQQKVAESFVKEKYSFANSYKSYFKKNKNKRIRIGYFSADFHNHAMSYLTANLFELHDKNKFELFGFSFGPNIQDNMKKRISSSFDNFYEVGLKSDNEISLLSQKLKIDIAIDLMGFTEHNRFGIFLQRCAPIQINYLGYPGTLSSKSIDYIIADKILILEDDQKFYSEKIIYMPDTYQVNDSKKKISKKKFIRSEFNLPENSFVLCCFNKNYKITPTIFNIWMTLLKNIKNSVLWLMCDNVKTIENLKNEASKNEIDPEKIIFAERLPLEDHLNRQQLADIFIDTFPYTAHTTCSDALWVGLPVVTCMGKSFASRVSSSLLNAIDLKELITFSESEYIKTIIELANNPNKLKKIKDKLSKNKNIKPLFNTKLFVSNLEKAYFKIYERFEQDLPPVNIDL